MREDKLHIIITGESGRGRTFLIRKILLRRCVAWAIIGILLLCTGTITGCYHWRQNSTLRQKVARIEQVNIRKDQHIVRELDQAKAELTRIRLQRLRVIDRYETRIAELQQEKAKLYTVSISRLDERNKILKTLMDQIGIKIKVDEDPSHSGGLYINPNIKTGDELLDTTDRYLTLLQQLPLGRPMPSSITSGYGRRNDPINHRRAFHAGIDFRGRTGDKVHATGSGVVRRSSFNHGGFGNCIVIRHTNGYETLYAHLSKRLVKAGDRVTRGQIIGLVGNTGRSTGSHLHYEVHYHKKTIDPMKFLRIAKLLSKK